VEVDPLGEGMRAWSASGAASTPVIALDPTGTTPEEADAHAASSLLGRIAGLNPRTAGTNGQAPPTGPRSGRATTTAAAAGGTFGIRGAARQPAPVRTTDGEPAPVKAKGAPKNVLLQRLAEAKADALRVSALKAARTEAAAAAAAAEKKPAVSAPAAATEGDERTGISVTPLKRAPRKPDVSGLKSRILERLQAERREGGTRPAQSADGGTAGAVVDESEEQALRRKLLERRKT
jgi:hypothetical protein